MASRGHHEDIGGLTPGSMTPRAKKQVREAVAAGEIDLLIGTHALIEESVVFERMALAIVDEQHRFGVAQRLALRQRSDGLLPHQLMMSATPIPRTLAMTFYADLDVSVIDELPPGRKPVVTKLISDRRRDEVIERVRHAVREGRQVYWVCPLIEESEALDLENALATHERLVQELAGLRVGLVHGRLPGEQKTQTMADFKAGAIDVLVATTVIEVGVDVPNASLMVIERSPPERVRPALPPPGGPGGESAADHDVREQRRVRDRAPRPGAAWPGRVPRRAPVGRDAVALCRPRAGRRPGRRGAGGGEDDASGAPRGRRRAPAALAGQSRGVPEGLTSYMVGWLKRNDMENMSGFRKQDSDS